MSKEKTNAAETTAVEVSKTDIQALLKAEVEKMRAELRAEVEAEVKAKTSANESEIMATESKVKALLKGMKSKLEARPKVKIKIPIDKHNEKDTTCFVQINGYTYTIKRGEEVEVPDVVKKQLERAGTI